MIAIFHTICIIARYVYVVLSESILAQLQENAVKEVEGRLSPSRSKYQVLACDSEFQEDHGPRFYPQVYVQRYCSVKAALEDERWKGSIRKIVDFGCAEFGFFPYLKRLAGVHEILEVDVDRDTLEQLCCRVSPLNSDYLGPRNEPLTVFVLEGSIAHIDEYLIGCDAVVCIELIEHVHPDVLEDIPYTVFGFIKPRVAIFTTPNGEFNVLFPNFQKFRHPDHKFEWTRSQFENWANNISMRYPDYKVTFHDIGWGPIGTEDVGACTQMAVFARCDLCATGNSRTSVDYTIDNTKQKYNLLRKTEYPVNVDNRTDKEKIRDQAEYSIRMFSSSEEFLEEDQIIIPLHLILPFVSNWTSSAEELEEILKEAEWKLVTHQSGTLAVLLPSIDSSVTEEESEECYDAYKPEYVEYTECCRSENWDDIELSLSEEKWDCDSKDLNFYNTDPSTSIDNSTMKQQLASPSSLETAWKSPDLHSDDNSVPSTSEKVSVCEIDHVENNSACILNIPVNDRTIISKDFLTSSGLDVSVGKDSKCSPFLNTKLDEQNFVQCIENTTNAEGFPSCGVEKDGYSTHCSELPENCDKPKCNCTCDTFTVNSSSSVLNREVTLSQSLSFDIPHKAYNGKCNFESCSADATLNFVQSSPSSNLYLNLQTEAQGTIIEISKKQEVSSDSPAAASVSLEEPNDQLADSGYPNSTSAQDMELDLTPEQVDELFTENDVVTDHPPDHHSDSASISSRDSDSISEQQQLVEAAAVLPQPDMLFEEAMNVENGDVANNNRDGEGNNALAVGALLVDGQGNVEDDNAVVVGIVLPENLDDLIPLFAAAEDLDNDNEIEINVVEPFPPWLLNLLGLANGGGGGGGDGIRGGGADAVGALEVRDIHEAESSDEGDSENNIVPDEGLGDENHVDSSSSSDTCPSEVGQEIDVGGEILAADL